MCLMNLVALRKQIPPQYHYMTLVDILTTFDILDAETGYFYVDTNDSKTLKYVTPSPSLSKHGICTSLTADEFIVGSDTIIQTDKIDIIKYKGEIYYGKENKRPNRRRS